MLSSFKTTMSHSKSNKRKKKNTTLGFLKTLHQVVTNGPEEIVGWTGEGGTSFRVFDTNRFEKELMDDFNANTWKAVRSRLKNHGFHFMKYKEGHQKITHPNFVQGDPKKLRKIKLVKEKKTKKKFIIHHNFGSSPLQAIQQQVPVASFPTLAYAPAAAAAPSAAAAEPMPTVNRGQKRRHSERTDFEKTVYLELLGVRRAIDNLTGHVIALRRHVHGEQNPGLGPGSGSGPGPGRNKTTIERRPSKRQKIADESGLNDEGQKPDVPFPEMYL